ncbi:MAG TPA: response regulator transcription factor [Cytophagaceae bacterium]|jgi:two-component system alkaline phosphatase synthesis response regulator PhoP|nr:response regulator transcription factor [Cytophagaceae bacterium]
MSAKKKILIVDDEQDILEILQYNLSKLSLDIRMARDGEEAVDVAREFLPELILLDIMMPVMDGIEACRQIRKIPALKDAYIIFLTARSEEYSEVAAFEAGANDFIVKPIKPRALMSRIEAFFRRDIDEKGNHVIKIKNISIDKNSYTVYKDTQRIAMARKEFELLYLFCQNPNKIFNREELLKQVWGSDVYVVSRTVDVHIRKIREKIGSEYINTIKGIGYKMELD